MMMPMAKKLGRAMGFGSQRAANYLSRGSKNAAKINARAATVSQAARAAGQTGPQFSPHNIAIRARQQQLAIRGGVGGVGGVGMMGFAGRNRSGSSYDPQVAPMTSTPPGSGRFA